jgi:hypothetical protein
MKKFLCFLSVALISSSLMSPAQAQGTTPAHSPQPANLKLDFATLSDTEGVNVAPYMRNLAATMKERMGSSGGKAVSQSTMMQEEAFIRVTIAPDGHILGMSLDNPVGDPVLSKVVWVALKDMPYQPLPTGMRDPNLQLRVHIWMN